MKNKPDRRGAGINPDNRFLRHQYDYTAMLADEATLLQSTRTRFLEEHARNLVNEVTSPDVGMQWSANPYQGCEHGCTYCYARNTHEYWGLSAGIDFEQTIIVKKNAPDLLRSFLNKRGWDGTAISLSGNTDCYQPAEQHFRITRKLLEICLKYRQPVGIITKNAYILKDIDILMEMGQRHLVSVMMTITTQNEALRRAMEPRTTTTGQRLEVIEKLAAQNIPCGIMIGPVIPGLNDHEMPGLLEEASWRGATTAAYTFVRLNGSVKLIFHNWLFTHFPDKAEKVWNLIKDGHGGQVSDTRFGKRMRGEGALAELISQQFKKYCKRLGLNQHKVVLDSSQFCVPGQQIKLF